jgi:hypothetical protein
MNTKKIKLENEYGLDEKFFARCKEIYESADLDYVEIGDVFYTGCRNGIKWSDLVCMASLHSSFLGLSGPSHPDSDSAQYIMTMAFEARHMFLEEAQKEIKKRAKDLQLSKKQIDSILDALELIY